MNARRALDERGVTVTQIEINKTPPDRAFLERHVPEEGFLAFVSTSSPVFKARALPTSRAEAIDLMVENPNLIKRPILVQGKTVTFGFDKKVYDTL